METKKTKKANLEGLKGVFFECGLVVGLAVLILAFSWSSDGAREAILTSNSGEVIDDIDDVINTTQDDPPPPPVVAPPAISDEILLVDNTLEITGLNLFNPEKNNDPIIEVPYVKPIEQKKEETFIDDIPIEVVQVRPTTWDGGDANSFSKWVASKIAYPTVAVDNRIQGKVILQFRIGADGTLGNIKVLRGVDPALDKEAVRVVSSSPKWNPGMQNNKPVGVIYTFPVNFILTD